MNIHYVKVFTKYEKELKTLIQTIRIYNLDCSGSFLKWAREEFRQMNQKTRKLTTMHKALHSSGDIDRLYVSRKEGREFASIEDCVVASTQRLEDYIKKSKERFISAANNCIENMSKDRKTTEIEIKTTVWIFQATN